MTLRTVSSSGERCCLAIDGELTIYSVSGLKSGLTARLAEFAALAPACTEIEIDLSGVSEIDTAGLQLMLMAKRIEGRNICFVNHSNCVLQLLEASNLAAVVGDPLIIAASAGGEK